MFEDIARQVLATGHRKRPKYFINEISKWKTNEYFVARVVLVYDKLIFKIDIGTIYQYIVP